MVHTISSTGWMGNWSPLLSLTFYPTVFHQCTFITTLTTDSLLWELTQLWGELLTLQKCRPLIWLILENWLWPEIWTPKIQILPSTTWGSTSTRAPKWGTRASTPPRFCSALQPTVGTPLKSVESCWIRRNIRSLTPKMPRERFTMMILKRLALTLTVYLAACAKFCDFALQALVLHRRTPMTLASYMSRSRPLKERELKELKFYVHLVGAEVASRMLLYRA